MPVDVLYASWITKAAARSFSGTHPKIRRVVRSTLFAEMLATVEGADVAIYLRHIIGELIPTIQPMPICMIVDNKSTVDRCSILNAFS